MALVSLKSLLLKAQKQRYAVGAFNVTNLESVQGVVTASEKLRSPVVLATSEKAIDYAGLENLFCLMENAAKSAGVPVGIHLDHGRDFLKIKKCIAIGYSSVMFDCSDKSFEENVRLTKRVVSLARKKGVSVEAELGVIGGVEDYVRTRGVVLTEPGEAREFVEKTGVDVLAVAIGTFHGAFKFAGRAKLDFERLKLIRKAVKVPLVLHGASGVYGDVVRKAEEYGGRFSGVAGVPDSQIKKAVQGGISKVNTDTDLRFAFTGAVRRVLFLNKAVFDPRKILAPAREAVGKMTARRLKVFGSVGMA
ncbi:MAG: class II fructose-1,6-bisphosphate aldolase [Candidatus Micrarchaeia archaeon]